MLTILAGSAATFTDSEICGDVAISPGAALTKTNSTISGEENVDDAVAAAGRAEFDELFDDLGKSPKGSVLTGTLDGLRLAPGVYDVEAAAAFTGVLILDGLGKYLIRVGAALTATGFKVALAGGARVRDVIWRAEAAVTLTDSRMSGRVLAGAAATITRGQLRGQLWARGAVTATGAQIGA